MPYDGSSASDQEQTGTSSEETRRSILKGIAGSGTGALTTPLVVSQPALGEPSDEKSIIVGYERRNYNDPTSELMPIRRRVPRDWYTDLQHARKAGRTIKDKFSQEEEVVGVGISAGEFGGESAAVDVLLGKSYGQEFNDRIPEHVDGTPVEITEGVEITPDGHSPCDDGKSGCNTTYFGSIVPGGVECDGDIPGTLMVKMFDENDRARFATAGHLWDETDPLGASINHPQGGPVVAEVVRSHCYDDFVLAEGKNSHAPEIRIAASDNEWVTGHFTKSGVYTLQGDGVYIKKFGRTSCRTCGTIENVEFDHWGYGCTPKGDQVRWGEASDSQNGDSGAPVYYESPNNSSFKWIVGFDLWSGPFSAGGTGAYHIVNSHNYHF